MKLPNFLIIDFDNTLIQGETLEMLAELSLSGHPKKQEIYAEIAKLTESAMSGSLDFSVALKKRLSLLNLHEEHIYKVLQYQKKCITPSFFNHRNFLKKYADRIYVVSGGFRELIVPLVKSLGLREDHVYANDLLFDFKRNLVGVNESNILSQNRGKAKLVQSLKLQGEGLVIGDGITDYEIVQDNPNCQFYVFTENVKRPDVIQKAHKQIANLDAILKEFGEKSEKDIREEINVLLLENVHPTAVQSLRERGFKVETLSTACDENELIKKIGDVHFLGIRSKTRITKQVLTHAKKLISVGAFCIGTDQIELDEAASHGVAVFNAPFSSTRSVVELAAGLIIVLSRQIFPKSNALHQGVWDKSTTSACEVRGKTLGIVGYGNIGSQLSILAENMGMHVLYYDLLEKISLGNSQRAQSLKALLNDSDIVTLHVDGRAENKNLFGENEFSEMKEGSVFLNLSRGHIVDIKALTKYLSNGRLKGAALDVYPKEPRSNEERFVVDLQNLPNVILTPHIGGSTLEAQKNIGDTVANRFLDYFDKGSSIGTVNFPQLNIPPLRNGLTRIFHIHENVPGILAAINGFFGKWNVNVEAQYLSTQENIGYVVSDVSRFQAEYLAELNKVPSTIKVRMNSGD